MKHYTDRTEFCEENPRCCCSEDDNCGCTFPENMSAMPCTDDITRTEESFIIKTKDRHIEKDTVCYCSPADCDCKIDYSETDRP